jgi:VIT1/CCC1 family predicted Fe2+/Mn2+ transporter
VVQVKCSSEVIFNRNEKMNRGMPESIQKQILHSQKNEITEFHIYSRLSRSVKKKENRELFQRIADDERRHYEFWRTYTGKDVKPNLWKTFVFFWIARMFSLTFGIKLMERGEERAQISYSEIISTIPEAENVVNDENDHEKELIGLIDEEHLKYTGSVVLGLNDALMELTGALAGLSLALRNTKLIALAGLITGIAASLSMAASEYLSTKSEGEKRSALKSSLYTGIAYIATVVFLILPYLLIPHYLVSLGVTLGIAVLIIYLFNYYISVAKDYSFGKRFAEMAVISLGVALLSFGIGYLIRIFLGVEV